VVVGAAVVDVGTLRFFAGCPDPPLLHAARTTAAQTATARRRYGRDRRVDVAADVPLVPLPGVGPMFRCSSFPKPPQWRERLVHLRHDRLERLAEDLEMRAEGCSLKPPTMACAFAKRTLRMEGRVDAPICETVACCRSGHSAVANIHAAAYLGWAYVVRRARQTRRLSNAWYGRRCTDRRFWARRERLQCRRYVRAGDKHDRSRPVCRALLS
jgi:hypothetical protein